MSPYVDMTNLVIPTKEESLTVITSWKKEQYILIVYLYNYKIRFLPNRYL